MFGYIVANKNALSEEELKRYRGWYCGLCESLREKHGINARMVLTYDMAFLAMLLSSLYEPETKEHTGVCPAHPTKPQFYLQNEITDYAADLNIALAYYKCLDDMADDKSVAKAAESKLLKKHMPAIEAAYPRQMQAIQKGLHELSVLESKGDASADACANAFGIITEEIFVYKADPWEESLRAMGKALGRFIYMMDAYDDIEKDARKNEFNPLLPIYKTQGFEETAQGMLTMLMGECVSAFERLPLVQDISILRNVLYSGVWTKYNYTTEKRNKEASKGKETKA